MFTFNSLINCYFNMSVAFIAFMVPVSQGIIVKLKEKYSNDAIIEIFLYKSKYGTFNVILSINLVLSFLYWIVEPFNCKCVNVVIFIIVLIFIGITIKLLYQYLYNVYRFSRGGVALSNLFLEELKDFINNEIIKGKNKDGER